MKLSIIIITLSRRGYLYQYPNNIGIAFIIGYHRIFHRPGLSFKYRFSTVTSFDIQNIRGGVSQKNTNDFVLIFFSSFPPMIMLNNLVYNDIYATTLFLGSIFNAMRFVKTENRNICFNRSLINTGNFLRQVGAVFLLAIIVYL